MGSLGFVITVTTVSETNFGMTVTLLQTLEDGSHSFFIFVVFALTVHSSRNIDLLPLIKISILSEASPVEPQLQSIMVL